jgi:hypothetical protein
MRIGRRRFIKGIAAASTIPGPRFSGAAAQRAQLGDDLMDLLAGMSKTIILERLAQTSLGPPAPARKRLVDLAPELVSVCRVIDRAFAAAGTWRVDGFGSDEDGPAGPPPQAIPLSVTAVADYLRGVEIRNRAGAFDVPALSTTAGASTLMFLLSEVPRAAGGLAKLSFVLPEDLQPIGGAATLILHMAEAFGAFHGHIHQEDLFMRYVARRVAERMREQSLVMSPELRQHYPGPPADFPNGVSLDLLHPDDFNRRHAPTGVWWINYWDAVQVRTLGEDRVRAAGWADVSQASEGALVLIATPEPPELRKRPHLEQLERLVRNLRLREAQERWRY